MESADFTSVVIRQLRLECEDVVTVELEAADGGSLAPYEPGAHIDVRIPGARVRSYSLLDPHGAHPCHRIGVKRESRGRGGSRWFHETARVGERLQVSAPKNDFPLVEDAAHSVFIAGGIGITPLLSMMARLAQLGRPWELHFSAREQRTMPFQALLARHAEASGSRVVKHQSTAAGGRMDVAAIVRSAVPHAHLYCCGPGGMIDDFVAAGRDRPAATVHYERFAAAEAAALEGGFMLELARDGRCLAVPPGKSVLDVLLDAGLNVPYSCTQGVCGSCRLTVLEGEPDHRDCYLTDTEKAANDALIPCCSGSLSRRLVVDL